MGCRRGGLGLLTNARGLQGSWGLVQAGILGVHVPSSNSGLPCTLPSPFCLIASSVPPACFFAVWGPSLASQAKFFAARTPSLRCLFVQWSVPCTVGRRCLLADLAWGAVKPHSASPYKAQCRRQESWLAAPRTDEQIGRQNVGGCMEGQVDGTAQSCC